MLQAVKSLARGMGRGRRLTSYSSSSSASSPFSSFEYTFSRGTRLSKVKPQGDRVIMFYDGSCNICMKEIRHYMRMSQLEKLEDRRVSFFDLTSLTGTHPLLLDKGVSAVEPYRRLHVYTEDGRVLTSCEAFCEVWKRLPYWKYFEKTIRKIPGALWLGDIIYGSIVDARLAFFPSKIVAFKHFDVNGKGVVTSEDLNNVLKSSGKNIPEENLNHLIEKVNQNYNGHIDFNDFAKDFHSSLGSAQVKKKNIQATA